MHARPSYLVMVSLAVLAQGCQPYVPDVLPAHYSGVVAPSEVQESRDYRSTNGETYSGGTARDDALLASASHDLACPSESVRPIDWVAPSRTSEYAFDACGKRAVYRWAYYRAADYSPSRNHTVERAILVNLFAVPP
jgi:hypothetical protein